MPSVRRYVWRVLPLLLLLALYWPGLTNWFYQDDFGWLNLRRGVHSTHDLIPVLFAPKAHGNMRPLGENAYFLILSSVFGVDALPFRICAFATEMASLLLLGGIIQRITASRAAGLFAQVLWIANTGLAPAMCWTSIYNQILSGFFFLLAFWFFLRQIETDRRSYAIAHWAAFVLGLGALETNVVYPAIAALYALQYARSHLKRVLPMFLVSALFIAVHFHFAPAPHEGVYALHFGSRMFSTLATYWMWAMGPSRLAGALLTVAALGFTAWQAYRRDWVPMFGLAWFGIVIGPYLPLDAHQMDYYLAVPTIGLATLGACALARAWKASTIWRGLAAACVAIYLGVSVPAAWAIAQWHHARGERVANVVLGVAQIHESQPAKIILLDGVDSDLFWAGIADAPFRVMEIPHVYLTPGSESHIQAPAGLVVKYTLPEALALPALRDGRAVVYQAGGPVLRNVTSSYRTTALALWKPDAPRFINLGDSAFADDVGPGWEPCADGYRILRQSGSVRIGGPRSSGDRLYISVFRTGRFQFAVRVSGADVPLTLAQRSGELTEFAASLPTGLIGQSTLEVLLVNESPEPLRFGFLEMR